jgi:serine/threonine-protein kinase RsbW
VKRLTLEIESDLGSVSMVALAINAICMHTGLGTDQSNQVELCIVEAITNSIRHAYRGELNHSVVIEVFIGKEYMQFDVYDTGTSMPREQVAKLIHGEEGIHEDDLERVDLKALPEGGRGLQLIRGIMDEVAYTQVGNRNRLSLIKRTPLAI